MSAAEPLPFPAAEPASPRKRGERLFGSYRVKTVRFELRDLPADPHRGDLLNEPALVKDLLRSIYATCEPGQERSWCLCLTARNRLILAKELYVGTLDRASLEPRGFLRLALSVDAASIIIAHNHPSGDPSPSREDREFTRRLAGACEAVGIRLLDHIVVGDGIGLPGSLHASTAVSFRESGLL